MGPKGKHPFLLQKVLEKTWRRLGPKSTFGTKKPEACLIELPKTIVHCDIDIYLPELVIFSMDNMEPNAMIKTLFEFNNKALILGRRVGTFL